MEKFLILNHKILESRKKKPALILAKKEGKKLHNVPNSFSIGGKKNYYFSHMLNCIYDCEYCFLQGKHMSAHYLLFVNYEDFFIAILTLSFFVNFIKGVLILIYLTDPNIPNPKDCSILSIKTLLQSGYPP